MLVVISINERPHVRCQLSGCELFPATRQTVRRTCGHQLFGYVNNILLIYLFAYFIDSANIIELYLIVSDSSGVSVLAASYSLLPDTDL